MPLLFREESFVIRGAIYEVYREMGPGLSEKIYQECLELEMRMRGIPFEPQPILSIFYKERLLVHALKPDFLCYNGILVEIKAVKQLEDEHRAQIINYLKATQKELGFLVNFCSLPKVTIERYVNAK